MSDFRPPPPRKGPPGPPPRPQAASPLSDPDKTPVNPFMVGPANQPTEAIPPTSTPPTLPTQDAPSAAGTIGSNPFMDAAVAARATSAPQAGAQAALPNAGSRPGSVGQAISAPQVGSIVGRPGAESPQIKDPHAEFRKGNVLKRLLLVAAAAAVVSGIVFLSSQEEPKKPALTQAEAGPKGPVIGSSVSPEIIKDPRDEPLSMKKPTPPAAEESAPERAPKSANSDGFASSFKSSAK